MGKRTMISIANKKLPILQFSNLNRFLALRQFSSTRIGGCSSDDYGSLNVGFNSGDHPENVIKNRMVLCDTLEINTNQLIFPEQSHTATVKTIGKSFFGFGEEDRKRYLNQTDALITAVPGVCIAIKTADCVPILVYDPVNKVIAAIHAGWRGTSQNIVLETIGKMVEAYGSEPSQLYAGIGPSIGPENYEVGEEVWKQFAPEFYQPTNPIKPDKRLLDLWNANYQQLVQMGISADHIEIAKICTLADPERFFSARRDGAKTGRMATGIMIR